MDGGVMKTVRQLADEIGVSKQAIHQKMKKEPLSTSLRQFTSTVDGVVYVSVDGENLIKSTFSKVSSNDVDGMLTGVDVNEVSTVDGSLTGVDGQIVAILQENLKVLQGQLAEKDKQIENLSLALVAAQQTAAHAQALHAGTMRTQLLVDGEVSEGESRKFKEDVVHHFYGDNIGTKKIGFLKRLFGKSRK